MSQTITLPSYADVTQALQDMESDIPCAEAHGLLCGVICATGGKMKMGWEKLLSGEQQNAESIAVLQQLTASSFQKMTEFSLEFTLLLPDDDTDINDRAEALGIWCQGFLTGLQQGTRSLEENTSAEVNEALQDLTEIAQINYGEIGASEEDETAYFELVEYVRLAVLMLYQELNPDAAFEKTENNDSLH
jgi:uncharacterized protein YgfB (UPF0149 family)